MRKTWSCHGAMLFDDRLTPLAVAEDVGRHNALDKAVGKVLMDNKLSRARVAVVSSRLSYELVQKAARAQVAVLIGMSRPTAMAVEMGRKLNMTLACFSKNKDFAIYCGKQRFTEFPLQLVPKGDRRLTFDQARSA
jgi:FdhD protein